MVKYYLNQLLPVIPARKLDDESSVVFPACAVTRSMTRKAMLEANTTINANDMFSYSLTTMMCFLTKELYGFSAYTVNLFIKAYHRNTYKEDLKSHESAMSLR